MPGVKAVGSIRRAIRPVLFRGRMAGVLCMPRARGGAVVLSDECYALMQWEDDVAGSGCGYCLHAVRARADGVAGPKTYWCCIR